MPTTKKNNPSTGESTAMVASGIVLAVVSAGAVALESSDYKGLPVAKRVSVQLQQTDPNVRMKERIVKKTEKNSMWAAMDIASIWLGRALHTK